MVITNIVIGPKSGVRSNATSCNVDEANKRININYTVGTAAINFVFTANSALNDFTVSDAVFEVIPLEDIITIENPKTGFDEEKSYSYTWIILGMFSTILVYFIMDKVIVYYKKNR